jgi:D-alanyl-D-alanine endopeptidase (penicillin-binding protein 7)
MIASLFGALAALTIRGSDQLPSVSTALSVNSLPQSQDVVKPVPPVKKNPKSLGIKTSGPSAFVADVASGAVLYAKDPHRVVPIASLTKLMTAMVFLDQKPDLSRTIVITDEDQDDQEKPVLLSGETVTLEDTLKAMLIGSVNAAAKALARTTVGTDKFVELMNEKAKALGLKSPTFVEPSGLDPGNQADAADVAAMLSIATSYPEIRSITKMSEVTIPSHLSPQPYDIKSTNLLLPTYLNKPPYKIIAAKTGSLPQAGYCMAQVTSNSDGHEIVAVELGSDNHFSRYQDIKALTTWAFQNYSWQ